MWKSRKTYLTNHKQSLSNHITPQGWMYTRIHILTHEQKQFQETRHVPDMIIQCFT